MRIPHTKACALALVQTIRRSGWQSLYAGLDSAIGATAVSQGIYFMVYSYLRDLAVVRGVREQVGACFCIPCLVLVWLVGNNWVGAVAGGSFTAAQRLLRSPAG